MNWNSNCNIINDVIKIEIPTVHSPQKIQCIIIECDQHIISE